MARKCVEIFLTQEYWIVIVAHMLPRLSPAHVGHRGHERHSHIIQEAWAAVIGACALSGALCLHGDPRTACDLASLTPLHSGSVSKLWTTSIAAPYHSGQRLFKVSAAGGCVTRTSG